MPLPRKASAATEPVPQEDSGKSRSPLGQVARAVADEIGLTTPENRGEPSRLSDQQIHAMIQEAAYHRAEARGFSPGYEEQDWLQAEQEIKARLGFGRPK
jgi:hypothetical protein